MLPTPLHAGKLPPDLLLTLLAALPTADPRLLVGPSVGEDAAVMEWPHAGGAADTLLVAKTDPITFATDEIGFYAVNVCANDIAVAGGTPRYYMPTVLLPAGGSDAALVERIFAQIGAACRSLGIAVAGGHSEVTPAVTQPVIAGAMLGETTRARMVRSGGARPGNLLLVAGSIPVEGTSIVARERRDALLALGWSRADIDMAAAYLHTPGISVYQPAHAATEAGLVTALHDPTEGGIATGIMEMATAARVGVYVNLDAIPISPLSARLCAAVGLDPLGTIASGALLAACAPAHVDELLALWNDLGWAGAVIGRVEEAHYGMRAQRNGRPVPFPLFAADELTRLWQA